MAYRDNSGIEHESYSEACRYYGVDTPEQAAAEAEHYEQEMALEFHDSFHYTGDMRKGYIESCERFANYIRSQEIF